MELKLQSFSICRDSPEGNAACLPVGMRPHSPPYCHT